MDVNRTTPGYDQKGITEREAKKKGRDKSFKVRRKIEEKNAIARRCEKKIRKKAHKKEIEKEWKEKRKFLKDREKETKVMEKKEMEREKLVRYGVK